jgi:hypothetical protein
MILHSTYRDHDHLGVHVPLRPIGCAIEVPFQQVEQCKKRRRLHYGPADWDAIKALGEGCGEDVDRHLGCWWDGKEPGTRNDGVSLRDLRIYPRGVIACDCASKIAACASPTVHSSPRFWY